MMRIQCSSCRVLRKQGGILCASEHVLCAVTMTLTLYQLDSRSEEEMKCGRQVSLQEEQVIVGHDCIQLPDANCRGQLCTPF